MKIKELHIKKLYDKYNFDWALDERVNILAGINGSFKSTLLCIIRQMCELEAGEYNLSHVNTIFSEGFQLDYVRTSLDSQFDTIEKKKEFFEGLKKSHPDFNLPSNNEDFEKLSIFISHFNPQKDGVKIKEEDFKKQVRLEFISTFDIKRQTKLDESQLDHILADLQVEYGYYLSDLAKRVSDFVANHESLTKTDLDFINQDRDLFVSIVNEAFKDTHKEIDPNESKIVFTLHNDHTKISAKKLSSGEKQFLIILLTVLLQKRAECIVVMDEPEISLHVHWQYSLIDNLLRLNPNAQYIFSTHSPSIFGKGWGGKVFYVNELMSTENG